MLKTKLQDFPAAFAILLALALQPVAQAQSLNGSVIGNVKDPSNALIGGAPSRDAIASTSAAGPLYAADQLLIRY